MDKGGSKWQAFLLPLWVPTFLGDADGATAHAHTKPIHTSINQVLSLGCGHHWGWKKQKEECEAGVPTMPRSVLGYPSTFPNLRCWARPILPSTLCLEQCHCLGVLRNGEGLPCTHHSPQSPGGGGTSA